MTRQRFCLPALFSTKVGPTDLDAHLNHSILKLCLIMRLWRGYRSKTMLSTQIYNNVNARRHTPGVLSRTLPA